MKTNTLTPELLDIAIRGRDGTITLCVDGEVCDFVSGTTRVFCLSDAATNGATDGASDLST